MCEVCNELGLPDFCTENNDLLCYLYSVYECNEILPALLTLYKYLVPETKVVDVLTSIVSAFPTAVDKEKKCSKCGEIKEASLESFGWDPRTRDKFASWCLECKRIYDQDRHLKLTYNKSREEILMMLCTQNDCCACCGTPIDIYTKKVHHSHKTGKIYDLLCHNCNRITGNAHDDYRVILNVAIYQAKKDGVTIEEFKSFLK